jgi:hypothetical protein
MKTAVLFFVQLFEQATLVIVENLESYEEVYVASTL